MVVFVVRRVVGFGVRRLEDLTDRNELLAGAEARVPENAVIHESPVLMALAISDNDEAESRRLGVEIVASHGSRVGVPTYMRQRIVLESFPGHVTTARNARRRVAAAWPPPRQNPGSWHRG